MTCIVGYVDQDKVYIGADSAGVAGHSLSIRKDEKVFINDNFIFGFTHSFRMGQILHYNFTPPDQKKKESDESYIYSTFVTSLIETFNKNKYGGETDEGAQGGTFLFGYKGKLYTIQSDYQVEEVYDPFNAVGCGADIALGSLYTTKDMSLSVEDKIKKALESASTYSGWVAPPFIIKSL